MGKKITKEVKKRVIDLYKSGNLKNIEIMSIFDISLKTLYTILEEENVDLKVKRIDDAAIEEAIDMYEKGYFLREIYDKTNISCTKLYTEIDERRIERRNELGCGRTKINCLDAEQADEVLDLYRNGMSKSQISVKLLMSYEKVSKIIEEAIKKEIIEVRKQDIEKKKTSDKTIKIAEFINEIGCEDIVLRDIARAFNVPDRQLYYHVARLREGIIDNTDGCNDSVD